MRKYRMYGLVPYNISPIQQAIQFGHAVVEFGLLYGRTPSYNDWAVNDKTFIILNGGTTNLNIETPGTLNKHVVTLMENGVPYSTFHEPDLGDQLTAVVFLVDDRVWDKETWPDHKLEFDEVDEFKNFLRRGMTQEEALLKVPSYQRWVSAFDEDPQVCSHIAWLRGFLRNFKLA
jgi:hypothetical protein